MARCPECNKFTSKNVDEEPEVTNDVEIDEDGHLTMNVRIVNQCDECSTELEEFEFELEGDIDVSKHQGEKHELELGEPQVERTDSGGARYSKRMFGVTATVKVTCSCGKLKAEAELHDEVASSNMDTLI